jgi:hypothetical protein
MLKADVRLRCSVYTEKRRDGRMVNTTADSANYLSLALDARKAIKALLQFSEKGTESVELKEALNDTVESLRALAVEGSSLFGRLHAQSPYQYYEQIKTLQEVQSAMKDERLADKLADLGSNRDPTQRREHIELAIAFFSALENRALQRYHRSGGSAVGR